MANKEVPAWYGGHDNPKHAGQHSHERRIQEAEAEMEEFTGKKAKQVKFPRGLKARILELMGGIEPPT